MFLSRVHSVSLHCYLLTPPIPNLYHYNTETTHLARETLDMDNDATWTENESQLTSSGNAHGAPEQNQNPPIRGEQDAGQEQDRTRPQDLPTDPPPSTLSETRLPRSPAPWTSSKADYARDMIYWWDGRAWQVTVPPMRTYIDIVRVLRYPASSDKAVGTAAENTENKSGCEDGRKQKSSKQVQSDDIVAAADSSRAAGDDELRRWSC